MMLPQKLSGPAWLRFAVVAYPSLVVLALLAPPSILGTSTTYDIRSSSPTLTLALGLVFLAVALGNFALVRHTVSVSVSSQFLLVHAGDRQDEVPLRDVDHIGTRGWLGLVVVTAHLRTPSTIGSEVRFLLYRRHWASWSREHPQVTVLRHAVQEAGGRLLVDPAA